MQRMAGRCSHLLLYPAPALLTRHFPTHKQMEIEHMHQQSSECDLQGNEARSLSGLPCPHPKHSGGSVRRLRLPPATQQHASGLYLGSTHLGNRSNSHSGPSPESCGTQTPAERDPLSAPAPADFAANEAPVPLRTPLPAPLHRLRHACSGSTGCSTPMASAARPRLKYAAAAERGGDLETGNSIADEPPQPQHPSGYPSERRQEAWRQQQDRQDAASMAGESAPQPGGKAATSCSRHSSPGRRSPSPHSSWPQGAQPGTAGEGPAAALANGSRGVSSCSSGSGCSGGGAANGAGIEAAGGAAALNRRLRAALAAAHGQRDELLSQTRRLRAELGESRAQVRKLGVYESVLCWVLGVAGPAEPCRASMTATGPGECTLMFAAWRHAGSSSATEVCACFQVESLQQEAAAAVEDSSGQQEALAAAQEEVEELRQQLEAAQAAADGWQRQAQTAHSAAAEVRGGSHRRAGG